MKARSRGAEAGQREPEQTGTVSSSELRNQICILARLSDSRPKHRAQVRLPPPTHIPALPHLGSKQVEMGSSHWPETLERRRGSGVS